jgi:hypothetical protein
MIGREEAITVHYQIFHLPHAFLTKNYIDQERQIAVELMHDISSRDAVLQSHLIPKLHNMKELSISSVTKFACTVRYPLSEMLWNPKFLSSAKTLWVEGSEKVSQGSPLKWCLI